MVEASDDPDFLKEPLAAEHPGDVGSQHLQGDVAVVLRISREVDDRHRSATEFPLDRVPVGEGGLQVGELVGHGVAREAVVNSIIGRAPT